MCLYMYVCIYIYKYIYKYTYELSFLSARPPATPFSRCSCHRISTKFSLIKVMSIWKAKVRGQRLRPNRSNFHPIWDFPDHNSSFNTQMATIWCTKFEVTGSRCPIAFQGLMSNVKVTQGKISPIFTRISWLQLLFEFTYATKWCTMSKIV